MSNFFRDPLTLVMARSADAIIGWHCPPGSSTLQAMTQAQFLLRVQAWQEQLKETTPLEQNKLALFLEDSLEFAAALFAAWRLQKTVYLSADTLEHTCQLLRKEVAVFVGQFPAHLKPISSPPKHSDFSELAAIGLDDDFPALVVYTSGSSGEAQAIPKKWSQLAAEIQNLEAQFGAHLGEASIIASVSHQHIYGLLFKILWPFSVGRAVHALALEFPEQILHAASQAPIVLIASPAHLKRIPEHLAWASVQNRLVATFSSGGPLPLESAHALEKLWGQAPIEVYGSSETGGIAWRQRHNEGGDAWRVFSGIEWKSGGKDGEGSLQVRSPYLPDEQWFCLADRIKAIDAQHFQLLGREDRIVKIEEKRISLDRMENALKTSALVKDVRLLVNTLPDTKEKIQRQKIVAFIALSELGQTLLQTQGKRPLNQALRGILVPVVEALALPRSWRYLDALPVNAQGKTSHAQLLALLETEEMPRPKYPHITLLEQSTERVLLELVVPKNLLYFDGHFPIAPILPGVVQIDWALYYAGQYLNVPALFGGMQVLKFQQVIAPEKPVQLELIFTAQKNTLQFRYFTGSIQHATGRILLEHASTLEECHA